LGYPDDRQTFPKTRQGGAPAGSACVSFGFSGDIAADGTQIRNPGVPDHDRDTEGLAPESGWSAAGVPGDLLSQVLGLIRLRGKAVRQAAPGADGLRLDPGMGWFVMVEAGTLVLTPEGGAPVPAVAGDLAILPQARGALLAGGDGPRVILGGFRFEGDNMPSMLAVLPPAIRIGAAERAARGEPDWIGALTQALLAEATAPGPGASLMISRLIDVLVIRAFRLWVQTAPPGQAGWLGALADARISRALKAIHDQPFRRWTVAGLASLAGMSRSNFAERFAALTGAPPLHYQSRWRLLLAQDMLRGSDARVGEVARRIGYDSEAAFNRAFRAQFGQPPGAARRGSG
jgi:AraC-like DNA-binding protein